MGQAITEQAISTAFERVRLGGERIELIDEAEKGLRLRVGERGAKWSYLPGWETRSACASRWDRGRP